MAVSIDQCKEFPGVGATAPATMKPNKTEKDIPLGINAKGSLIELAHKLKWANKHFGTQPSTGGTENEENELHHGKVSRHLGPWMNGSSQGDGSINPDEYVIQAMFSEGRPHPLMAYGEALFQNALHGEPNNFTSLGTVHSFNGSSTYPRSNGLASFSATSAMNNAVQLIEGSASEKVTSAKTDETKNPTVESSQPPPDSMETDDLNPNSSSIKMPTEKHKIIEKFIEDHPEILQLNLKPSFNNVVGPSLWRLLTATKEVREIDHRGLSKCFKVEKPECENAGNESSDVNVIDEHPSNSDEAKPLEPSDDTEMEVDGEDSNSSTAPKLPLDPLSDIRDRLSTPLTEWETSIITASAVDLVVRQKTPSRVLSQLQAMQTRHNRVEQQNKTDQTVTPSESIIKPSGRAQKANDGCLRKYHCPNCSYQTDNKSHLRRHISSVHFIGMPYYCYICNSEFPRSEKVKAHFTKVHPEVIYDHRLVRKDKFFGVHYSPENTPMKVDASPGASAANTDPKSPKPKNARKSLATQNPVPPILPFNNSTPATDPRRPVWKSAVKSTDGEKRFFCPECPYTGKDIWHLKRHFNDVHQQRKDLKCPQCDYSTGRKHRLVSHMKNHGVLYCFHCDFTTSDLITFQSHVKVCSLARRRSQHQCTRCLRPCSNRKQLQDHVYKEHGVVLYCCELCMFYSESDADHRSHVQQHQERTDTGYVCQVCNAVLDDYKALRQHLSTHRQAPMATGSTTITSQSEQNPTATDPGSLKCPSCDYIAPDASTLKDHRLLHVSDEKLVCDINGCDFSTVWPLSLEHHKKIKHLVSPSSMADLSTTATPKPQGKGTFFCPVCKDNRPPFRYKRSFNKHMAQHQEDEEKCPLCAEVFYFRAALKDHLQLEHQARVVEVSSSSSSEDEDSSSGDDSSASDDDDETDKPGFTKTANGASTSGLFPRVSGSDAILGRPMMSQGAAMEAYGPGAARHGSMAPFL